MYSSWQIEYALNPVGVRQNYGPIPAKVEKWSRPGRYQDIAIKFWTLKNTQMVNVIFLNKNLRPNLQFECL